MSTVNDFATMTMEAFANKTREWVADNVRYSLSSIPTGTFCNLFVLDPSDPSRTTVGKITLTMNDLKIVDYNAMEKKQEFAAIPAYKYAAAIRFGELTKTDADGNIIKKLPTVTKDSKQGDINADIYIRCLAHFCFAISDAFAAPSENDFVMFKGRDYELRIPEETSPTYARCINSSLNKTLYSGKSAMKTDLQKTQVSPIQTSLIRSAVEKIVNKIRPEAVMETYLENSIKSGGTAKTLDDIKKNPVYFKLYCSQMDYRKIEPLTGEIRNSCATVTFPVSIVSNLASKSISPFAGDLVGVVKQLTSAPGRAPPATVPVPLYRVLGHPDPMPKGKLIPHLTVFKVRFEPNFWIAGTNTKFRTIINNVMTLNGFVENDRTDQDSDAIDDEFTAQAKLKNEVLEMVSGADAEPIEQLTIGDDEM